MFITHLLYNISSFVLIGCPCDKPNSFSPITRITPGKLLLPLAVVGYRAGPSFMALTSSGINNVEACPMTSSSLHHVVC